MLQITVPSVEFFDAKTEEFFTSKEQVLQLEHSLVSLSKWESRWRKPFLAKEEKTYAESIDYIRCMTITQNVPETVYKAISSKQMEEINSYIEAPMTATRISSIDDRRNRDIITAEIIYYWMILYNIPFECQKWHLNRLITLINVCSIKNSPGKKMNKKELLSRQKALNEARKAKYNTKG